MITRDRRPASVRISVLICGLAVLAGGCTVAPTKHRICFRPTVSPPDAHMSPTKLADMESGRLYVNMTEYWHQITEEDISRQKVVLPTLYLRKDGYLEQEMPPMEIALGPEFWAEGRDHYYTNTDRITLAPDPAAPKADRAHSGRVRRTGERKCHIDNFTVETQSMSSARISGKITECAYEMEEVRDVVRNHYAVTTCPVCKGSGKASDGYFNCAACGGAGRRRLNKPMKDVERIAAFWEPVTPAKIRVLSDHFTETSLDVNAEGCFEGVVTTKGGGFLLESSISPEGRPHIDAQEPTMVKFTLKAETSDNISGLEWSTTWQSPHLWIPH